MLFNIKLPVNMHNVKQPNYAFYISAVTQGTTVKVNVNEIIGK